MDEEQLGQPSGQKNSGTPIKVTLPSGRKGVQVAGGDRHSLVLLDDATVFGFGSNLRRQLGSADEKKRSGLIEGLSGVQAVAAGGNHSIALKQDGSVWTFGSNVCGQLGNGTKTECEMPVQVAGLKDVVAIAAHVWTYNPRYASGLRLPGALPLEELLFSR